MNISLLWRVLLLCFDFGLFDLVVHLVLHLRVYADSDDEAEDACLSFRSEIVRGEEDIASSRGDRGDGLVS